MPLSTLASAPTRRGGERVPLATRIRVTDGAGRLLVEDALCANIGLGGVCIRAPLALDPGSIVRIELVLLGGRTFSCSGHVCWSKQTLHPALLGTPKGTPEDASFGVAFDAVSTQDLLPIARLLVAREDSRRRGRRLRRIHGLHARA